MSFLPSKGPDVSGAIGIGHSRVVIGDMAYLPGATSSVWNVALLLHMPSSVTEQALIDVCTVVHGVSILIALEVVHIVLIGAVLLPICKVIKPGVEHGSENIRGYWGIVKDVWLKMVEGIGMGQGA
jgi:hypothetical protein